jgi:hypothetical protein
MPITREENSAIVSMQAWERTRTAEHRIDDVAKALDLLLHMVCVLEEDKKPSAHDIGEVRELIRQIKNPLNEEQYWARKRALGEPV